MEARRELDALVAEKVMGWRRMTEGELYGDRFDTVYPSAAAAGFDRSRLCSFWLNPAQRNEYGEPMGMHLAEDDEDGYGPESEKRFAPSTDIAAAWEVVETLDARPDHIKALGFRTFEISKDASGWYLATFHGLSCQAGSTVAAEAICLAALKAVGAEVPA